MLRRLIALVLVFSSTASSLQPQTPAPADQTIKTVTRIVVVDVVVRDGNGQPVRGLKAEDFTVAENGKPETIASFSFTDASQPRPAPKPSIQVPASLEANVPTVPDSSPLIILLMDSLNTPTADQVKMRQKMLEYLTKLHAPGTRMAIFALGANLVLLQDFTTDLTRLKGAIEKYRAKASPFLDSASNVELPNAEQQLLDSIQQMDATVGAFQMQARSERTLGALRAIARSTSGYSGRKHLVWLSGGFPTYFQFDDNRFMNGQEGNFTNEIKETTNQLSNAQIAVYPVDASGLVGISQFSAENSGRGRTGRTLSGAEFGGASQREFANLAQVHQTMNTLADETGGKAYYNRNDLDGAVAASAREGEAYYTLAYYPTNKNWDGKYRKIKVQLKKDYGKLTYRHGYFATDPTKNAKPTDREVGNAIQDALLDPLPATALPFYGAIDDKPASKELRRTGITMEEKPLTQPKQEPNKPAPPQMERIYGHFLIDPHELTFEQTDKGQKCDVEFIMGVFKDKRLIRMDGSNLNGDFKPATMERVMKEGISINIYLDVPKGPYRVRLILRDNKSGRVGSLERTFVPAAQAAGN
jgi:VWFA-related protein